MYFSSAIVTGKDDDDGNSPIFWTVNTENNGCEVLQPYNQIAGHANFYTTLEYTSVNVKKCMAEYPNDCCSK